MISESSVLWAVSALLAGILWGMRLEGKVRTHDTQIAAHDRELQQLRDDVKTDVEEVKSDLKYIRERIDRFLSAK